jgi:hypothetical protein
MPQGTGETLQQLIDRTPDLVDYFYNDAVAPHFSRAGVVTRSFQDHVGISLRILKGRSMARPAARVASVMSRRPVSR